VTNKPIAAAQITLAPGTKSGATGNDGTYELADLSVGAYTVTIKAPGYDPTIIDSVGVAAGISKHMSFAADMTVGYDPASFGSMTATGGVGRCTTCHMPKTAASQSRFWHELVDAQGQPAGPRIRGDVSAHDFRLISPAQSQTLFVLGGKDSQLPNSCGSCHNALTGIAPSYTW
jgi:hypothetical protein